MIPRSLLLTPRVPGGYLDNPPEGCPNASIYCPNTMKYDSIRIVEYVRCDHHNYCKESRCQRKTEADQGRRHRIRNLKANNGEENGHS